jgi:hypothetical protein
VVSYFFRYCTDPDSRIMKSKDGFVQAYNAQAAVDAEAQIIVAQDLTQSAVDSGQLVPMTDAIETNLGRKPEQLSADAGYCSEANLEALENRSIDGYVATGRARDAVAGTVKGEVAATTPSPEPAAHRHASRPCARRLGRAATPAPTGCASSCPSLYSGKSNRHAASVSSCCAALRTCAPSGPSSAPSTIF